MNACATCVGRCSPGLRAEYARACCQALAADRGYPECREYREKTWIDGADMKSEFKRIKRLPGGRSDGVVTSVFDVEKAYRMAESVYTRIEAFYRPGSLAWVKVVDPDLFAIQERATAAVDAAFEVEDLGLIKVALGDFGRAMRAIAVRFEEAAGVGAAGVVPCAQMCTMSIRHDYNFNILDLGSQEIDAEQAIERARINPLANNLSDRRLLEPGNSQQQHVQGCALNQPPSSVMKENLNFRANDQVASWF